MNLINKTKSKTKDEINTIVRRAEEEEEEQETRGRERERKERRREGVREGKGGMERTKKKSLLLFPWVSDPAN